MRFVIKLEDDDEIYFTETVEVPDEFNTVGFREQSRVILKARIARTTRDMLGKHVDNVEEELGT